MKDDENIEIWNLQDSDINKLFDDMIEIQGNDFITKYDCGWSTSTMGQVK